jgi:hypothetical protein
MTDRLDFETRLEERLHARAALASRPFDAVMIAREAVAVSGRRRRIGRFAWGPANNRLAFAVVVLLLAISLLGAVAMIGALLREPPRPPRLISANGLIAVSANPWDFGGGENGDIYVVRPGTSPHRIIGSDGDGIAQQCPRFSPDGGRLAYGEARASGAVTTFRGDWPVGDRAVVVVGVDDHGNPSTPLVRVALPGTGHLICAEWSPDGHSLAFRVGAELWIANSASGEARVVPITNVTGRQENELEWSRDGSMIAVAEPGQIRIVRVGRAPMLIEVDGGAPRSLGWTADDTHILYVGTVPVDEVGSAVHVVDVDGTNDVRLSPVLTPSPGVQFSFDAAAVSPEGTRVAYLQGSSRCTTDGCGPGPDVAPIAIANVDGRNRVELSMPRANPPLAQGFPPDFFASGLLWAPDGQGLLLSSIAGVVSVDLESGVRVIVYSTGEPLDGLNLEWSWSEVTWQPMFR